MKTSKFRLFFAAFALIAVASQNVLLGMKKTPNKDSFLDKLSQERQKQVANAKKILSTIKHEDLFKYFEKELPQTEQHPVNVLNEFISWLEKLNDNQKLLQKAQKPLEDIIGLHLGLVELFKKFSESHFEIRQSEDILKYIKNDNPHFKAEDGNMLDLCSNINTLNVFLTGNNSLQPLCMEEEKIVSECSDIHATTSDIYAIVNKYVVFLRKNKEHIMDLFETTHHKDFKNLAQVLIVFLKGYMPIVELVVRASNIRSAITSLNTLLPLKNGSSIITKITQKIQVLININNEFKDATSIINLYKNNGEKAVSFCVDELMYLLGLWTSAQALLSDMNQYKTLLNNDQLQALLQEKSKKLSSKVKKFTTLNTSDDTLSEDLLPEGSLENKNEFKIKTTQKPYSNVSHYISCWLSGKGYWGESLKKIKSNYGYNDSYMAQHNEELVQSHALPLEADDFITSLAIPEPWFNAQGVETGLFYTVPGYLENHRLNSKLCGLFTWGISLNGKCLHRSFSIRKDEELFDKMKHSEYQKEILDASQTKDHQTKTLGKKHNFNNPVTQDEWYVMVHSKETGATLYLSKCLYKQIQKRTEQ